MSKKRSKPPENKDEAPDSDRPTVAPPFDPEAFAKETMKKGSSSSAHTRITPPASIGAGREKLPTLTDPFELEDARKRSVAGSSPPNRSNSGPLALVNMNAPSMKPEAPEPLTRPAPAPTDDDWSDLDRAWADDKTRKPSVKLPSIKAPLPAPAPPPRRSKTPGPKSAKAAKKRRDEDAADVFAKALNSSAPPAPVPEAVGEPEPFAPSADGTLAPHTVGEPEPFSAVTASKVIAPGSELAEMRDRFSLGDYTGALEIAEKFSATDPSNDEARECAQNCRTTLEQMYTARIGPLDRVPVVMVPREQLRWLSIDHRAGFVLSLIDGVSSVEMILDVSGMPLLDALRILCELAQQRIVSFR